jgi:hypothetical protein
MAINFDKAYEVENGIILSRDGAYLIGGNTDPTGSDAPVGTWYLRLDTKTLWYKYDTGVNDWRQISADDITALDTSVTPNVPSTVQALLNKGNSGDTPAVSQTCIFGSGGNIPVGTYLPNNGVSSNVIGIPVPLANAKIRAVSLANENLRTGNILIQQRSPAGTGVWTTIYTLSLTNENFANDIGVSVSVTQDAEIAVFTEISLKSVKVVVQINGDAS